MHVTGTGVMAFALPRNVVAVSSTPDRGFEHGNPLNEFGYGQVELQPSPQHTQLAQTRSVLMGLNEDSLLRPFRKVADLPTPGVEFEGWYGSDGYLPGNNFGMWVSALSRSVAMTGDLRIRDKIGRLVNGFGATVEPDGKLYDKNRYGTWLLDKLVCGLLDAHQFASQPNALDLVGRMTDAALPHFPPHGVGFDWRENSRNRSYTIPENQFIAWQRGGDARHLRVAKQYLYDSFFDALAQGKNVLPGLHAYSHVLALSSAAKAYLVLGEEKYRQAAMDGLAFIESQSYATGAWGPNESFLPSPGLPDYKVPAIETPGDSLALTHSHFETPCCAYGHFKLTRYLLRITKNPHYGDSMERVMYNTVLGAKPLRPDGRAFYYSDYQPYSHKTYYAGFPEAKVGAAWPCCAGTLTQVAADYGISTYLNDADGVYVNLYIPSTLRWQQAGATISLTQSTRYPLADTITFDVDVSRPAMFALRLRIPEWAVAPTIRVNGKHIATMVEPGTFATLQRTWRTGDRIELALPRKLELRAVDAQHPELVALVYGPIVLFAIGSYVPQATRTQLLDARQQGPGSEEWVASVGKERVRFLPWWVIGEEIYTTYLSVAA